MTNVVTYLSHIYRAILLSFDFGMNGGQSKIGSTMSMQRVLARELSLIG